MPSACVVQVIWQRPGVWSNRGMDVSRDVSSGRFKSLKEAQMCLERDEGSLFTRVEGQWSSSESFIHFISLRWRSMRFLTLCIDDILYKFICLPEWAKYAFRFLITKREKSILSIIMFKCLTFTYPAGWEEVRRDWMCSWQQHGTLWAGQDMNSWKLDSKKRRSTIPRHYWGFLQKLFFHFSLILSQKMSIVINSGWEIENCFAKQTFRTAVEIQWKISIIGRNDDPEDMHLFI